jgi:hypothetical protein
MSLSENNIVKLISLVRPQCHICKGQTVIQVVPDEFSKIQVLVLDLMGLKPAEENPIKLRSRCAESKLLKYLWSFFRF